MRKYGRVVLALASAAAVMMQPLSAIADGPGGSVGSTGDASSSPESAVIVDESSEGSGAAETAAAESMAASNEGTETAAANAEGVASPENAAAMESAAAESTAAESAAAESTAAASTESITSIDTGSGNASPSGNTETTVSGEIPSISTDSANAESTAANGEENIVTTGEGNSTGGGAGVAVMDDDDSGASSGGSSSGGSSSGSGTSANTGYPDDAELGEVRIDDVSSEAQLLATGDFWLPDEGKAVAEPILGHTPTASFFIRDPGGNRYDYGYSTMDNEEGLAYSAAGFQSLYLEMVSIGRYYYRVYTAEHGWSPWAVTREATPASDNARVQAVQIRVKGYTHNLYELYYKAVLNDGSETDWAQGGQACGTMGGDRYIVGLKLKLWRNGVDFTRPTARTMIDGKREGVYYDADGYAHYSTFDGHAYTGWAYDNNSTAYYFHEGERLSGWNYLDGYKYYFDEHGKLVTDLEPLLGISGDYQIMINKPTRTLYIMARDDANGYIIPYKTYNIADGDDTPIGTFHTYVKYRWKFMHDDLYCQFLARFYQGFLLHSLPYNGNNLNALNPDFYNYMDDTQSGGCIRMVAGEAAWVYENVPMGAAVVIYQDRWNKGPVEKPAVEEPIPADQHYDPTDPVIVAQQNAANASAAQAAEAEARAAAEKAAEQAGDDAAIDEHV